MNTTDELKIIESLIAEFYPEIEETAYIADETDLLATHRDRLKLLKDRLTERRDRLVETIASGNPEFMPDLRHVTRILQQIKPFELRHPEAI